MDYFASSPPWSDRYYEVYSFKKDEEPIIGDCYMVKNSKMIEISKHEAVVRKLKDKLVYKVYHLDRNWLIAALIKI